MAQAQQALRQERRDIRQELRGQGLAGGELRRGVRAEVHQRDLARIPEPTAQTPEGVQRATPHGQAPGETPFRIPYRPSLQERRGVRRELKQEGLRGQRLKGAMKEWRSQTREARQPQVVGDVEGLLPEPVGDFINRRNFMERLLKGDEPYPPIETLTGVRAARRLLGYDVPQDQLQGYLTGQLGQSGAGGAAVPTQRNLSPTLGLLSGYAGGASPDADLMRDQRTVLPELSAYTRERLAENGLTPEEEQAIRLRQRGAVESSYRQGTRDVGQQLSAAGIDPRSGIAAQRALQLQRGRQAGLADVEAGITQAELGRKAEIENLGRGVAGLEEESRLGDVRSQLARLGQYEGLLGNTAGLEEAGRRFDVTTPLERQGQVENRLMDLANLSERQRIEDLLYGEGMRQAQLAREAYRKAANKLEPGALEITSSVLGGLLGGVGGR